MALSIRLCGLSITLLATLAAANAGAPRPGGVTREVGPGSDWCEAINAMAPGDELVLLPGDHSGPCTIRTSGRPGAPIVIRGAESDRPLVKFLGTGDNVLNVRGSFVTLRRLAFGPTRPDIDAIRIRGGEGLVVEDCTFTDIGGSALVSNTTTAGVTFADNEIVRSRSTAIYLGCHDGSCAVTDAVLQRNYIAGVEARQSEIGYGVQVKLNSTAAVRDNVIVDTKGPGVMIYGSRDRSRSSVVERNFFANSRTSAGLVIGGGPVVARNNISVGAADGGIVLEDYGTRRLLHGIVVTHNTVHRSRNGAIRAPGAGKIEADIVFNAVHALSGSAVPAARPGLTVFGNVDCRFLPCFTDPLALDFRPVVGSMLLGRPDSEGRTPEDDFFGVHRPPIAAVGAVEEQGAGVVRLGRKSKR